ncbi:NAD(P)/FAD-dependent oxidoreductase [Coxiella burnetii]|uniref:NAD(P)/FAD-dependent oxidoreductase n=1 Tax=Coxiella burnetii TaxID=777 RepID=UPI0005950A1B|nr:NAD(P)/FAD-dependent oxidoreductase [Coxiella burnetii]ATN74159.1 thioredoxin reductase [Coxiella burnetii]ATN76065.1 thioredoxin reductase [Coxiella burnetii]ATN77980.1 thioredoxin reductase [Coxiella burnetii]ATN79894.1 thioredoxin reductase [Coxiella burnetii]OYK91411.1 NAD(P)/FAD-dependent oxidoreductase [Coxiella burnetii]
MPIERVDVAIVGGSFSGLSAALLLGNSLRNVIVIDDNQPRNLKSAHAFNLLGNEQTKPLTFLKRAHKEVQQLETAQVISGNIKSISCINNRGFTLQLQNGPRIESRKIILATGVVDELPAIKGIETFWPDNIFHCPYCIGYAVKNEPLAVYSTEEEAYVLALIIHKWTSDFILFTDGHEVLSDPQLEHLKDLGIRVYSQKISQFTGVRGKFIVAHLSDQQQIKRRGIFMHLKFKQRAPNLIADLACSYNEENLLHVNEFFKTSVDGVYAIGDIALKVQKMTTAIASGSVAAFAVDHELTDEMAVFA